MNKGFSLVELIVVIAIMAILVGVAVPVYTNYINKTEDAKNEQLLGEIEHAIEILLIDNEVTNPANGVEITVDDSGLSITADTAESFVNTSFLAKVKEIIDGKTTKAFIFTISGFDAVLAD